ncbi:MAG: HEAT repeat domain-containing protein [Nitrospirae bacterium]|nr:HEAT repeat domain-containing protein [Nitrospirota bacterium]
MVPSDKDNILVQAKTILAYFRTANSSDYSCQTNGLTELRQLAIDSEAARDELRRLIYEGDSAIRILAAEALSRTASFPADAIPVLIAALDVGREPSMAEISEPWLRIALGAIANFEEDLILAEKSVWPYIYTQNNINLQLYAITAVSKMAKVSSASWTILCLLCNHENQIIRDFTRNLMNSDSFNNYLKNT